MVLRKPYAFLIKYFMIIHIVLSVLMIYVCSQFRIIISFIKDYINNTASVSTAGSIIGIFMFLAIIFIMGISFTIFWLMKYKNKPKLLYLFNIILYGIIFVLTIVLSSTFINLNNVILDSKTIRLYRDIVNIVLIFQYVFIIAMIVRTLGFDIKKFNFSADISELAIDSADNEEVEVNIGINTTKLVRGFRRYIRELKYYYEENKLVIIILLIGVITICFISMMPRIIGKERMHGQNEVVSNLKFTMNVSNSYITKLKYDGSDVSIGNNSYIITKLYFSSLYNSKYSVDTSRFVLHVGKNEYYPSLKQYNYFTDIGYGYNKQELVYNTSKPYILVFVVSDDDIKKTKTLIYTDVNLDERKIRIKPVNIDVSNEVGSVNVGEELIYKGTVIGDGSIKINSVEFANNYGAMYAAYNKKILKLDITSSIGRYSIYDFFNKFVKLKYIKDGNEKTEKFINRTNRNSDDGVYLDVSKEVEGADTVYLEVKIRSVVYKYFIKGGS